MKPHIKKVKGVWRVVNTDQSSLLNPIKRSDFVKSCNFCAIKQREILQNQGIEVQLIRNSGATKTFAVVQNGNVLLTFNANTVVSNPFIYLDASLRLAAIEVKEI